MIYIMVSCSYRFKSADNGILENHSSHGIIQVKFSNNLKVNERFLFSMSSLKSLVLSRFFTKLL